VGGEAWEGADGGNKVEDEKGWWGNARDGEVVGGQGGLLRGGAGVMKIEQVAGRGGSTNQWEGHVVSV